MPSARTFSFDTSSTQRPDPLLLLLLLLLPLDDDAVLPPALPSS